MRVLFWVPYPTEGASNRYRVEQYLPYLRQRNIKCILHPFWSSPAYKKLYNNGKILFKLFYFLIGAFSRVWDSMMIFRYDMVFIHREAFPLGGAFFETFLSLLKKPFIFDFDDAIFLPSASRPNSFIEKLKSPAKVNSIIKKSSQVIAGNPYLADFSKPLNSSVSVIPTSIDTEKYCHADKESRDKIIIGWMGSITTLDFLKILEPVFLSLSARFKNIEFVIVGGNYSCCGLSNITSKEWSLESEKDYLKGFDIGIMPVPDNEWTRGKCGFKAILYMGMGIPTICSPVGMNKEIIEDGVNGFLAYSQEEWTEKLSLLIKDSDLRKRIGSAGRRTVEEKYSVKINAPKLLAVLNKVYDERYKK